MEILFTILKIIIAAILLIFGLACVEAFKSLKLEIRIFGDTHIAPWYKIRSFLQLVFGLGFIITSIYLFCAIVFNNYGAEIMISLVIIRIIGILLIIFSISSFIQSFRRQDSHDILLKEEIVRDPNKTSRNLRIIALIVLIIGIMMISYKMT
jgi:uncharacterized membrane protein (DUF485 family)